MKAVYRDFTYLAPSSLYAWCLCCLIGFAALTTWPNQANAQEYSIGQPSSWVVPVEHGKIGSAATAGVTRGLDFVLVDEQVQLTSRGKEHYRHYISQAVSEQGVNSIASVQIGFDPSYQKLALHGIDVIREGKIIPKLSTARIQILQRELDLEYQIYDGSKTLNVELEDIRIGDAVEYSYTISGSNPVFNGKSFGAFDFQWDIPVQRASFKLRAPAQRPIFFTYRNAAPPATTNNTQGFVEYTWQLAQLPALVIDDDTPTWFDPYPVVQWSEFKEWAAVAKWAMPIYESPTQLTPALEAEVNKIKNADSHPEAQLLSVLRFVQRDIRYLGVEIGAGSHKPNSPDLVLKRRFGDCKDKSMLTITLLRALGIEAKPALVDTDMQQEIAGMQPSPGLFNHVIVKASINGTDYWIDPTRTPHRGPLRDLYQPNYGLALVVDPASRDLTPFSGSSAAVNKRQIQTTFDSSEGLDKPVHLVIRTTATGAGADSVRSQFESAGKAEMQKNYLNFYADYYDEIRIEKPIEVSDSDTANEITITERYLINNFWSRKKDSSDVEANFDVPDMMDYIESPENRIRTSPLAINHPIEIDAKTRIKLPRKWTVKSKDVKIDSSEFKFEHSQSIRKNTVYMSDYFASKSEFVSASQIDEYVKNIDLARRTVGIKLYTNASAKKTNGAKGANLVLWLFLIVVLYAWLQSLKQRFAAGKSHPTPQQDNPWT